MKLLTYITVILLLSTASVFADDQTTYTNNPDGSTSTTTTSKDSDHYNSNYADRSVQLGADYMVPYEIDPSHTRTASLFGAHAELFFAPAWSISLQGIFGVEDRGFVDNPVYITPGTSLYFAPGRTLEPFVRAEMPILLNNDNDIGARGGLGFMWNLGLAGLGLRYSFDVTYFFQDKVTSLNLANVSAVVNW